jgi:hypothetical protein
MSISQKGTQKYYECIKMVHITEKSDYNTTEQEICTVKMTFALNKPGSLKLQPSFDQREKMIG